MISVANAESDIIKLDSFDTEIRPDCTYVLGKFLGCFLEVLLFIQQWYFYIVYDLYNNG